MDQRVGELRPQRRCALLLADGEFEESEKENEKKSDHWALANGYVAVTPTTVDVTAYGLMDELKTWF